MSITIHIPTTLRDLTAGAAQVSAQGDSLGEVIDDLERRWPGLEQRLLKGRTLVRFMNLYVNDQDVRFHGGLEARVAPGDEITILPAVAGGQDRRNPA